MEGGEKVEKLGATRLHWVAKVAGKKKEWDAEITEQTPDQRVAWTATSGAPNGGVVTFHRLDDSPTRGAVQMEIEPEGPMEKVGDAAGIPDHRVKGDLERFKEFIEKRGTETGAWRGEVKQNDLP